MTKRLIITILITIAIAEAFSIGITLHATQQSSMPDTLKSRVATGMLILTTVGCMIGITMGTSFYSLISRANGPRWAKVFLSVMASLFIAAIIVKAVGHPAVCPVISSRFDGGTCSGGDCCFPEIGIAMWAGITAMLFGAGLGQHKK